MLKRKENLKNKSNVSRCGFLKIAIKRLIEFIRNHILLIILIALFGFFFFYRLDYQTLASWDEAWYASISRNMVKTGDYINMTWNAYPYYDHPPMGFWLIAALYKLFGINEFTTRLPSAILSIFTIILVYFTGIKLFKNKFVGYVAALMLGTSVWYLIRVRSGNLDAFFVFFYILTIFLSLFSSKKFYYFPLVGIAFGCLMLTKTLVGLSVLPLIVFINLNQIIKIRKNLLFLVLGIAGFFAVVYPWYYSNISKNPLFIEEHFIIVGMRNNKNLGSFLHLKPEQPLFYLHMGVRKWYYFWLLGGSFLLVSLAFLKKPVAIILFWNLLVLYPFLTSDKTHLWHLIPAYLPMVFISSYGIYKLGIFCSETIKKVIKLKINTTLVNVIFILSFSYIAFVQIKIFYNEVIPTSKYISDDVAISKSISKYKQTRFIDDDFAPIAVFYSGDSIIQIEKLSNEKKTLLKLFQSNEKDFVVITRNWAPNSLKENNIPYKVLEKNNSYSIVSRP